jgi:hypothetical protein
VSSHEEEFCGFDHFWSSSETASHATLSSSCYQQASSIYQIVEDPGRCEICTAPKLLRLKENFDS